MWRLLLERLSLFAGLRATLPEWERRLGPRCHEAFSCCFRETTSTAESIPCRSDPPCGYSHEIRSLSGGRLLAVCEESDSGCDPFPVDRKDLAVYRIDLQALAAEIAEALSISPQVASIRLTPTLLSVGQASHNAEPVFVGLPARRGDATRLCETVAMEAPSGAILLLPTETVLDGDTRRVASARHVRLAVLSEILTFDRRRGWMAERELEDLFPASTGAAPGPRRLHLPAATTWRQIVVTVFPDDRISISHLSGNPHRTYSREELGFMRDNGKPKKAWDSLIHCIEAGCIPVDGSSKSATDARNRARDVTRLLHRATGIEGNAFRVSDAPVNGSIRRTRCPGQWPLFKIRRDSDRIMMPAGNYHPPPEEPDDRDDFG